MTESGDIQPHGGRDGELFYLSSRSTVGPRHGVVLRVAQLLMLLCVPVRMSYKVCSRGGERWPPSTILFFPSNQFILAEDNSFESNRQLLGFLERKNRSRMEFNEYEARRDNMESKAFTRRFIRFQTRRLENGSVWSIVDERRGQNGHASRMRFIGDKSEVGRDIIDPRSIVRSFSSSQPNQFWYLSAWDIIGGRQVQNGRFR